ncbi:hypothetical protein [uncultured Ruegeria sp.]|uniref:hypothetical protein n=1 Tax=uncultured Ruegeria sp. TaxID=259304 RepID=UPI002616C0E3|nr:hypothetical protein [uncultured Ruegeria sp.]
MSDRQLPHQIQNSYDRAVARFSDLLDGASAAKGSSVNQVSIRAKLPRSTAYRQFETLEQLRITNRAPSGDITLSDLGWRIGFSAWGFGDVSPFAAATVRYLRIQSRRTSFLGVLTDRKLQAIAYSASRGLSFRSLSAGGQYVVSTSGVFGGNTFEAQDRDSKMEFLILQDIVEREFGSLRLGVIALSSSDARELDEHGLLSDTAHRLRVALRQE